MTLTPFILMIIIAIAAGLGFIIGLAFGGAMRESARCDEYHSGYVAGKGEGP